ncbi:MAG: YVTN family beta-propeller repeat-containing protein, partial [Mucinivorans sp.]
QGWMNTSAVSVIDATGLTYKGAVIVDEPNRGAAGTWGIAQGGSDGDKIIISHSGTHDVSIVDYKKMIDKLENYKGGIDMLDYDLRFLYGMRDRVALTGNGPRAMSVSQDGAKVYVPTYFSDTVNIVDLTSEEIKTVALNPDRQMNLAQVGERIFNDATYCFQNWQSCNGCHPGDARTDGMNWDLMNDGIGNSKNCKSLLYSIQTAPSMISGIRVSAELANRKGFTHIQFSNIPEELALAVDAYTRGLEALNSPFLMDGKLSPKAEAGRAVFDKLRCGECHSGPYYTDMKMHRIGENIEFEAGWDTPTLREVWRTAPYLFDGRAATMREVFSVHKHGINRKISDKEIDELTEYVNSL